MAGVLRGWRWEQQQRAVFCLAQVAVCLSEDLHKHSSLLTWLPRAHGVPIYLGGVSLQSACAAR